MKAVAKTAKPEIPIETERQATPSPADLRSGLTRSQKAAAIIAVLGQEAARPIVDKLDDHALAKVMTALEQISLLPRRELAGIVLDFLEQLNETIGAVRGGRERARALISAILEPGRAGEVLGGKRSETSPDPDSADTVWEQLKSAESSKIAAYLDGLTPNIIAIILGKLDVSKTSEILIHLDEAHVIPTMRCLVDRPQADPGLEAIVARMVQLEFLNVHADPTGDGEGWLEEIGELLTLIPQERRQSILDYLQAEHETKMPIIQRGVLSLDNLPDILPRAAVPTVFREIDDEILTGLLSMAGDQAPRLQEFLLGSISSRMADQFRDQLSNRKAPDAEGAAQFERRFLSAIMELRQTGVITLDPPQSGKTD